jgi:hypothetical protein
MTDPSVRSDDLCDLRVEARCVMQQRQREVPVSVRSRDPRPKTALNLCLIVCPGISHGIPGLGSPITHPTAKQTHPLLLVWLSHTWVCPCLYLSMRAVSEGMAVCFESLFVCALSRSRLPSLGPLPYVSELMYQSHIQMIHPFIV